MEDGDYLAFVGRLMLDAAAGDEQVVVSPRVKLWISKGLSDSTTAAPAAGADWGESVEVTVPDSCQCAVRQLTVSENRSVSTSLQRYSSSS